MICLQGDPSCLLDTINRKIANRAMTSSHIWVRQHALTKQSQSGNIRTILLGATMTYENHRLCNFMISPCSVYVLIEAVITWYFFPIEFHRFWFLSLSNRKWLSMVISNEITLCTSYSTFFQDELNTSQSNSIYIFGISNIIVSLQAIIACRLYLNMIFENGIFQKGSISIWNWGKPMKIDKLRLVPNERYECFDF